MSDKLISGDRVYFISAKGRKLRCRVVDTMNLKARGEEIMVPVVREINRKPRLRLDGVTRGPLIRWFKRSALRKLPN